VQITESFKIQLFRLLLLARSRGKDTLIDHFCWQKKTFVTELTMDMKMSVIPFMCPYRIFTSVAVKGLESFYRRHVDTVSILVGSILVIYGNL